MGLLEKKEINQLDYRNVPKRKLSEAEKQIIMLRIEKVKLQRERNLIILNKSIIFFFAVVTIAVVGMLQGLISSMQLNMLVVVGIVVLVIGVIPYGVSSRKEEKGLENTIDELIN